MNTSPTDNQPFDPQPAVYRIVLEGRLGSGARSWFDDAEISVAGPDTELRVVATDQAALHGVLRRIHDLHLRLVSLARIDTPNNNTNR